MNRTPPANIARQLRQEAGFGCVQCGDPFVEFHHIVEWKDKKHFNPNDMVAVCPNCHARFGRMTKTKQYQLKGSPHNIAKGTVGGALVYSSNLENISLGGNSFQRCQNILGFNGAQLLGWRIVGGEYLFSLKLHDKSGNLLLLIVDNIVEMRVKDWWDFVFKLNYISVRSKSRSTSIDLDFRKAPAELKIKAFLEGVHVKATQKAITFENPSGGMYAPEFVGCLFSNVSGFCVHFYTKEWELNGDYLGVDAIRVAIE